MALNYICTTPAQAFKALKAITMSTLLSWVDAQGHNPLWPGIQYKGMFVFVLL
jgi:hypothetical protein